MNSLLLRESFIAMAKRLCLLVFLSAVSASTLQAVLDISAFTVGDQKIYMLDQTLINNAEKKIKRELTWKYMRAKMLKGLGILGGASYVGWWAYNKYNNPHQSDQQPHDNQSSADIDNASPKEQLDYVYRYVKEQRKPLQQTVVAAPVQPTSMKDKALSTISSVAQNSLNFGFYIMMTAALVFFRDSLEKLLFPARTIGTLQAFAMHKTTLYGWKMLALQSAKESELSAQASTRAIEAYNHMLGQLMIAIGYVQGRVSYDRVACTTAQEIRLIKNRLITQINKMSELIAQRLAQQNTVGVGQAITQAIALIDNEYQRLSLLLDPEEQPSQQESALPVF